MDSLSFPSDFDTPEEHGLEERESASHPRTVSRKRPHSHSTEVGPSATNKRSHRAPVIELIGEVDAARQGADLLKVALTSAAVSEEEEASLTRLPSDLCTTGPAVIGVEESPPIASDTGVTTEQRETEAGDMVVETVDTKQGTTPDATSATIGQDDARNIDEVVADMEHVPVGHDHIMAIDDVASEPETTSGIALEPKGEIANPPTSPVVAALQE